MSLVLNAPCVVRVSFNEPFVQYVLDGVVVADFLLQESCGCGCGCGCGFSYGLEMSVGLLVYVSTSSGKYTAIVNNRQRS